jgi:hypothetical protein
VFLGSSKRGFNHVFPQFNRSISALNSAASSAKDSLFEDKKRAGSEVRNRPFLFK